MPAASAPPVPDPPRADIEFFARDLEARGRARATITRRLCTVAGFYRYAVEEELRAGVLVAVLGDGVRHGGVEDLFVASGDGGRVADLVGYFAAVDHLPEQDGLLSIGVAFGWKVDGTIDPVVPAHRKMRGSTLGRGARRA